MKNGMTSFFMAWGNFLNVPCPVKKWDAKLNKKMLMFLPLIGLVVSLLMILIFYGVNYIPCSALIKGFIAFIGFFLIVGFIHWDGVMDVSDAIFSRKSIKEKQVILKDSQIGAFAVLAAGILLIGYYACFSVVFINLADSSTVGGIALKLLPMVWIFILSRWMAGLNIMNSKAMKTSQYASNADERETGRSVIGSCLIVILIAIFYLVVRFSVVALNFDADKNALIVCVATLIGTGVTGLLCKKSLGGMNGDIGGTQIVVGDLCGFFALAIL